MDDGIKIVICHCTGDGHPMIEFPDGTAATAMTLDIPGTWSMCELGASTPEPHPDPEAVWADFFAAQLQGKVEAWKR